MKTICKSQYLWLKMLQNYRNKLKLTINISDEEYEELMTLGEPIDVINEYENNLNNNDYEFVDLDLPSGTLWATKNIGALTEIDYGNYYQWGSLIHYNENTVEYYYYDGYEYSLPLQYDIAHNIMGGDWHIPTETQFNELMKYTTYKWVENYKNSGINGCSFISNNKTLFLPATGQFKYLYDNINLENLNERGSYWSSSPYIKFTISNVESTYLVFRDDKIEPQWSHYIARGPRKIHMSVRAVLG